MVPIQFNFSRIIPIRPTINRNIEVQAIRADHSNVIEKPKIAHPQESAQDAEFAEVRSGEPLKHIDIYV